MRLANPKPGICSVCYGAHPERRYVDFDTAFDGAPVLDRETRSVAILPWTGRASESEDLYICEMCLREACELLGLKPELHRRQLTEIKRQELQIDHLKATVQRLREELDFQLNSAFGPSEPRRKVAA